MPDVASTMRGLALSTIAIAPILVGCLGVVPGAGDNPTKLQNQAQAALTRWADAVHAAGGGSPVVLVGERTGMVGVWEEAVGDNNKQALMAELVEADAGLPREAPPAGEVRWQDGSTATVPLVSAQAAAAAIRTGTAEPCGECAPLLITDARLTTGPIVTSRGPATAPVWEFTLDGTAVKVTRAAIANPITIVPPPWDPNDPPAGLSIDSANGTVEGRQLTVGFVGAPLPGDQACGEDYTADAVESDLAIVVIVTRHPHVTLGPCTADGAARTASVELAAPLGERAVLEVREGLPVPVTTTP